MFHHIHSLRYFHQCYLLRVITTSSSYSEWQISQTFCLTARIHLLRHEWWTNPTVPEHLHGTRIKSAFDNEKQIRHKRLSLFVSWHDNFDMFLNWKFWNLLEIYVIKLCGLLWLNIIQKLIFLLLKYFLNFFISVSFENFFIQFFNIKIEKSLIFFWKSKNSRFNAGSWGDGRQRDPDH